MLVVVVVIRAKNGSYFLLLLFLILLLLLLKGLGPEVGLAVDEVAGLDDLGAGPVGHGTALSVARRDSAKGAPKMLRQKNQFLISWVVLRVFTYYCLYYFHSLTAIKWSMIFI